MVTELQKLILSSLMTRFRTSTDKDDVFHSTLLLCAFWHVDEMRADLIE